MIQGYDDTCGVMYAPSDWPYPIAIDGEEVKNWNSLRLELKDGMYCPFHCCVGCANVIDENMKNLMEKYINDETQVEFLPVKAHSDEYGEKQYFILHFLKIQICQKLSGGKTSAGMTALRGMRSFDDPDADLRRDDL